MIGYDSGYNDMNNTDLNMYLIVFKHTQTTVVHTITSSNTLPSAVERALIHITYR